MGPSPRIGSPATRLPGDREAMRWLWAFVRPHRRRLLGILALSVISTGVALIQPYLTKLVIDEGLLPGNLEWVAWLCGAMLLTGVLAMGLGGLSRWLYISVSGAVLFAMRESVYGHLLRLDPRYHAEARGGDLMSRLDGDIAEVQRFSVDALLASVNGVLALGGSLAMMLVLSWRLTLLALVFLPVKYLFLRMVRPRVETQTRTLRERVGDITSFFVETLPAAKFIQSVSAEARERERLAGLNQLYLGDLLRLQMTQFAAASVPNLMTLVSTAAVFLVGGYLMVVGELTLGTLIAFTAYMARSSGPVQTLLGIYLAVRRARVSLERVRELTEARPTVHSPEHPRALPAEARGALRLEGVAFRHQPGQAPVLDEAALEIPAGAKVAIVGASGVGKSTLIDLLHRHYDPDAGRILLDGVDVRELELAELRRRIAVVAQEVVLFRASVAENIRYAAPGSPPEAVHEAAVRARLHDFIQGLPEGYDTVLGERGATLSAGQRQRISIARALLQEPLVLVLDEATSAIDRETEVQIMAEVDRLFADRTRLVITHRPELQRDAEQVVELREGRLHTLADAPRAALP